MGLVHKIVLLHKIILLHRIVWQNSFAPRNSFTPQNCFTSQNGFTPQKSLLANLTLWKYGDEKYWWTPKSIRRQDSNNFSDTETRALFILLQNSLFSLMAYYRGMFSFQLQLSVGLHFTSNVAHFNFPLTSQTNDSSIFTFFLIYLK